MENRYGMLPFMAGLMKVMGVLSFLFYWFGGVMGIIGISQKIKQFLQQPSMMGAPQKLGFADYVQAYQDPGKLLLFGVILLAGLWALADGLLALRNIAISTVAPAAVAEIEPPADENPSA